MTKEEIEANRIIEMFKLNTECPCYSHADFDKAKQCALLHVEGLIEYHNSLFMLENKDLIKVKQIIESK